MTYFGRLSVIGRSISSYVGTRVGFRPRFEYSPTDRADRVTRARYQELLFSASVLGAAIALKNCRPAGFDAMS